MRVDFYQLTRDPAERLVPILAQKIMDSGERLLIISGDEGQRTALSEALWTDRPHSFLAHDFVGCEQMAEQPILIGEDLSDDAPNGATRCVIADGEWRDAAKAFERAFFLFTPDQADPARDAWRAIKASDDCEAHYWRQDGKRWIEAG